MTAIVDSATQGAPNMTPDYELKFLLKPTAVLGPNTELTSTVLSTFNMPPSVTKLHTQFLDTTAKDIYTAGWSARIRKSENEDDLELTYKKRYAVIDGDIDAALTTANIDGFDAGDAKYEAQVEWGYQKQTLSITHKKKVADSVNSGMDLPGTCKSRAMLVDNAPDKFDNWLGINWGTDALAESRIFGPVLAKRSIGSWDGMRLYIEVWLIRNRAGTGNDCLVEASFKTESRTTALTKHDSFISYLQEKAWFLEEDSLKTQLIMERY
ncbi:glucose dehydrogenase [Apiospora arundinis]